MNRNLNLFFFQFIALDIQYIENIDIFVSVYFRKSDFVFNLKILIEKKQLKFIFEQFFNDNTFREKFTLNDTQQLFIINILKNCFILIQSSLDIDKNYINIIIIKILLKNRNSIKFESIIYIYYTNYVLDQFFEHLIKNDVK